MTGRMIVSEENLEAAKEYCAALDQRRELEPGCETWAIHQYDGGQRGQMTIWPSGRGAVMCGGDSVWGEWDDERRVLVLDDGTVVDECGEIVTDDEGGEE